MCSNWTINGHHCQSGSDLVAVIGLDAARKVNGFYSSVGEMLWSMGPDGRKDFMCTEATVDQSCLCHVDPVKMAEVFGGTWTYDCDKDSYTRADRPSPAR